MDIVRLADRLGVQFAFPTQTVHLYKEEKGAAASLYDLPRGTTDRDATDLGIQVAREITEQQSWREGRPGPVRFDVPVISTEPEPPAPELGGDG